MTSTSADRRFGTTEGDSDPGGGTPVRSGEERCVPRRPPLSVQRRLLEATQTQFRAGAGVYSPGGGGGGGGVWGGRGGGGGGGDRVLSL